MLKNIPNGNAVELDPKKSAEYVELGEFYFINQKWDKAIETLQKALEYDPKNPEGYYNLGVIFEARNKKPDAKEMFEKALHHKPEHKAAAEHLRRLVGA
ncbi:MAG: tetratricopeptide repeat protein [Nitrospirota bacterium]|nr:tetratricopeptide repeat protein [Nitrospirota bacterium]